MVPLFGCVYDPDILCLSSASDCACRYGPDVGEAAGDLSHATIEGGMAYFTITRMGVRSVAKRIAKRTAKGLVKNATGIGRTNQGTTATASQVSTGRI